MSRPSPFDQPLALLGGSGYDGETDDDGAMRAETALEEPGNR